MTVIQQGKGQALRLAVQVASPTQPQVLASMRQGNQEVGCVRTFYFLQDFF